MKKVKILINSSASELEYKINEFMKEQKNILTIQLTTSSGYITTPDFRGEETEYQALIYYEVN